MQKEPLILSICVGAMVSAILLFTYCPELFIPKGADDSSADGSSVVSTISEQEQTTQPMEAVLDDGLFVTVGYQYTDKGIGQHIVYDKNTGVMYLICETNKGVDVTPMYNADGTLQIYQGATKEDTVVTTANKVTTTPSNSTKVSTNIPSGS